MRIRGLSKRPGRRFFSPPACCSSMRRRRPAAPPLPSFPPSTGWPACSPSLRPADPSSATMSARCWLSKRARLSAPNLLVRLSCPSALSTPSPLLQKMYSRHLHVSPTARAPVRRCLAWQTRKLTPLEIRLLVVLIHPSPPNFRLVPPTTFARSDVVTDPPLPSPPFVFLQTPAYSPCAGDVVSASPACQSHATLHRTRPLSCNLSAPSLSRSPANPLQASPLALVHASLRAVCERARERVRPLRQRRCVTSYNRHGSSRLPSSRQPSSRGARRSDLA